MEPVPFVRLAAAHESGVRQALDRVLASGRFVLGPEVETFETAFARFVGVRHAVGVASGTDALTLSLAAVGVGPGDRVLTTAFSAGYTAVGIARTGACPVFCDVEPDTLGLDPEAAVASLSGGRFAAVVPVHLYGSAPHRFDVLLRAAESRGIPVIEDACQAHGASFAGRRLGSFGGGAAFSFYPTKNLAALGDGGIVATDDPSLAARVRRLRSGGQSARHLHAVPGWNSRLDELQAAVLSARLPGLEAANAARRRRAERLREGLADLPITLAAPRPAQAEESACHLFVVRTPRRDALRSYLRASGVETHIHYPVPLPMQPAFGAPRQTGPSRFPEACRAADEVLSLPFHPRLSEAEIERIEAAVRGFFRDDPVAE